MVGRWSWLSFSSLLLAACATAAFEVPISDTDYDRQICSGMWGGKNAYINVTFDASSQGQLAMVIYEWGDVEYLGKDAPGDMPKYYVCTSDAMKGGYCDSTQLGHFIVDLPPSLSINDTSFWSARVALSAGNGTAAEASSDVAVSGFWDNPEGNPTPPDANSEYTTPWRKRFASAASSKAVARGFWDNPEGNPTPPDANSEYTTPWFTHNRRDTAHKAAARGFWDNPEGNPNPPDAHSEYTTPWFTHDTREASPKAAARGFWDNPEGNPTPPDAHSEYTTPWFTSPKAAVKRFWDNPEGNPTPPDAHSKYTTPWRKRDALEARQGLSPSPSGIHWYTSPIQYYVKKTGYYCIAMVPITVVSSNKARQDTVSTDNPHPTYQGTVFFRNTFDGRLPASDYPKVNFYFAMFLVYSALAVGWGWLCYQNVQDLLPIQHYLSGLLGFLIIEMLANWAYYRYLNAHGEGTPSTVFLIVVAILDAGRNALSFFLLLVVSLGLSVVKESLGRTMLRCQLLAGAHFVFGVLYAVGIVELELESASALILLLFVIPLAFTLSGFLLWIIYSLNATIAQLAARKQRYKLSMFNWLHRILLMTVVVIAIFFVVSSLTFSGRLAEDYGAKSWKMQWWLLDGWLALLYLVDFVAISWLWRPSPNNRRLAMFDEIAQDEEDAEDYDLESLEHRTDARGLHEIDDDAATLVGRPVGDDAVVFEIGDEDGQGSDDEDAPKKRRGERERHEGAEHEREGLMKDD